MICLRPNELMKLGREIRVNNQIRPLLREHFTNLGVKVLKIDLIWYQTETKGVLAITKILVKMILNVKLINKSYYRKGVLTKKEQCKMNV